MTYQYDQNSNVTGMTSVEKSDLGNPDQAFDSTHAFDNLDRLTTTVDNVGNTSAYAYDSRSNRVHDLDSLNRACFCAASPWGD